MPQNYGAEYVKCPFYCEETRNTLKCEGDFSETCTFTFKNRSNKNLHKNEYCKTFNYKNCSYAAGLLEMYKL